MSWAIALAVDRVAWWRIPFGVSDGRLTWSHAVAIVTELRAEGRDVTVTAHRPDAEHPLGPTGEPSWTIRSTNRHHRAVMAAMARAAAASETGGQGNRHDES